MQPVEEEVEDVRQAFFVRASADVSVVTVPAMLNSFVQGCLALASALGNRVSPHFDSISVTSDCSENRKHSCEGVHGPKGSIYQYTRTFSTIGEWGAAFGLDATIAVAERNTLVPRRLPSLEAKHDETRSAGDCGAPR